MKVGILGSGEVGQALGDGFVSRGHEVKLGAREATNEKVTKWAAKHRAKGSAGTFRDAAAFGEIVVLATLWSGTESALRLAGIENFKGKVVLDVTNPLLFEPNQPPKLALGHTDSGGEQIQRWLPGARVVKVFNIVGQQAHGRSEIPRRPADDVSLRERSLRPRRRGRRVQGVRLGDGRPRRHRGRAPPRADVHPLGAVRRRHGLLESRVQAAPQVREVS